MKTTGKNRNKYLAGNIKPTNKILTKQVMQ
jgi:hypothetical protein